MVPVAQYQAQHQYAEIIAHVKAHPGTLRFGHAGPGGLPSVVNAMISAVEGGLDVIRVPYDGDGPALTGLQGGAIDVMPAVPGAAIEPIRAGRMKVLAIMDTRPNPRLPDAPQVPRFIGAWGIENPLGPNGLSAPRALPVAKTAVMAIAPAVIPVQTARLPPDTAETFARDILPARAPVFVALLVGHAMLLRPPGFLPPSAPFPVITIRHLGRRGSGRTLAVSLGSPVAIRLVFRIVLTVPMPAGIVAEAEIIQLFRNLLPGRAP